MEEIAHYPLLAQDNASIVLAYTTPRILAGAARMGGRTIAIHHSAPCTRRMAA
jgi:hypothetical protein